ncbi:MAG: IS66 family transposase [Planctomycetota bacterium]|nr:IS66 family transposase [Planctomycetota bacterium]
MAEPPQFQVLELTAEERLAFLERVRPGHVLSEDDFRLIEGMVKGLPDVLALVERRGMTIGRLRQALFGARTEKTAALAPDPAAPGAGTVPANPTEPKPKRKGHGRHAAHRYSGARRVRVPHPCLHAGDLCPDCHGAKLYPLRAPALLIRLVGQAPLAASVFELEKLRCTGCGTVFTAPAPPEAGSGKYDETVAPLAALMRYGTGVPMHRLAQLQASLGIPFSASTQWQLVAELAGVAEPVWQCLIRQAAQRNVIHNDDTPMRVASLRREPAPPAGEDPVKRTRTGIFTTGILTGGAEPPIALFFTGHQHAGENLQDILRHRDPLLPAPIQMCDALSRNVPTEIATLLANCLVHGRRQMVDVAPSFPVEARHVLECLRDVFHHDAIAREEKLTPEQRLSFHQSRSGPILEDLHRWLQEQLDQKKVEPNSGLGGAFQYLLNHWAPLTLFLREPGAPLENNVVERALKMAILHRKNSLSYKTQEGARVGDLFMSLIHSCRLNDSNPFEFLVALARHPREVADHPEAWLPWTYRATPAGDTS